MNSITSLNEVKIVDKIYIIRGEKVMIDSDLAQLYGVETKQLKRAVRRNIKRFPPDFMFEISKKEYDSLRYQIGTLKIDEDSLRSQNETLQGKHSKYLPFPFTEQGVAMLSGILNSDRAIQVNIAIMRAFVHLRKLIETNKDLAKKIGEMESKYDQQFQIVFEAIKKLIKKDNKPRKEVGYLAK
jgi:hypothetical protein